MVQVRQCPTRHHGRDIHCNASVRAPSMGRIADQDLLMQMSDSTLVTTAIDDAALAPVLYQIQFLFGTLGGMTKPWRPDI